MNEKKRTKTENKTGQRASVHVGLYNDGFLFQCCHLLCVGLVDCVATDRKREVASNSEKHTKTDDICFSFSIQTFGDAIRGPSH